MLYDCRRGLALTLLLATAGCSASPYYVGESRKAFLPARAEKPQRLGEVKLMPGDVLFTAPVGYREAATLAAPVSGTLIGKPFAFDQGALLTKSSVFGAAATAHIPRAATVLCGPAANAARVGAPSLAGALIGTPRPRGPGRQVCLIDADSDGTAERAFLAHAGKLEEAAPVTIAPVGYKAVLNEPMPGDSGATLTYAGKPGRTGGDSVGFRLAVMEQGNPLYFDNVRTAAKLNKLPQRLEVMSGAFTVKSYNPIDGTVVVDVERGFQEGEYGITATTTTRYIPIYVPR